MPETINIPTETERSIWAAIREAIRGSAQDFTEGNLRRAIVLLAIPMVLEMVMESLFAIVDVFWVAHLGADSMATVGLTESGLMLIYCGAMGLSMAATAMVARRIGEKDAEGAAVSTTIGRSIGVVYQLWILFGGTGRVRILTRQLGAQWDVMRRLIRVALNGMFQYAIGQTSWMVLVRIVSSFGSAAVAGYTVAIRIFIFVILPSWGLASAAATLVGQNLGAGKPDRAERSVWLTTFYNMLFLGAVGVLLIVFPEPIIRVFTDDPAVIAIGVDCLRVISYGNVAYACGMVMVQSFNGAGDTFTP